ncbi:unnamed protein product [Trifolium pratense]|uniref:Uncharacterized protein n=1 Tax=Trifolium pratense TaxID=57577 RepID=A0ACB0LCQ3_TRIPR|nr:unnamed protein product [Trifolium pratense]
MAKTFMLVPAIIIFLFLFLITTKEVDNNPTIVPTTTKCESHKDCMKSYFTTREDIFICKDGFCLFLSPLKVQKLHT